MNIGMILDWIGKNLGRLKTIGILILMALFIVTLLRGGCDRREMEELVERITGLNLRNDILREDIKARDSLIIEKEKRIAGLKDSLTASEIRLSELKGDFSHLEAEYESLSDSLQTIPASTSYSFLVNEAYPYEGHRKYPFNEPQVKGIHLTFLENISLVDLNSNLLNQLDEVSSQLHTKDAIVNEQDAEILLMQETRQDLDSIIYNKDEVIGIKDEQIKKERRNKHIWQSAMGAVIVILTILAAGSG